MAVVFCASIIRFVRLRYGAKYLDPIFDDAPFVVFRHLLRNEAPEGMTCQRRPAEVHLLEEGLDVAGEIGLRIPLRRMIGPAVPAHRDCIDTVSRRHGKLFLKTPNHNDPGRIPGNAHLTKHTISLSNSYSVHSKRTGKAVRLASQTVSQQETISRLCGCLISRHVFVFQTDSLLQKFYWRIGHSPFSLHSISAKCLNNK
jgi:hypothetical protein